MRKLSELEVTRDIVVVSHKYMDPDSIASSNAIKCYMQLLHPEIEVFNMDMDCRDVISNVRHEMIEILDLDLTCVRSLEGKDLIFVDSQPNQGNSIEVEDMSNVLAIIDHHFTDNLDKYSLVDYVNIAPEVGSASTLVYHATSDIRLEAVDYTALLYGLLIDTQDLIFQVSKFDLEAHKILYELSDHYLARELKNSKAPLEIIEITAKTFKNYKLIDYNRVFVGYCGEDVTPRNLSIMADTVLKITGIDVVVMYTKSGNHMRVSGRTGAKVCAKKVYDVLLKSGLSGGYKMNQIGGVIRLYSSTREEVIGIFIRGWKSDK